MTDYSFTNNGFLEENLDSMHEKLVEDDNKDMVVLVVGSPGSGKSALTAFCQRYMKPDCFGLDQIEFDHEDWVDAVKNNNFNSFINYDEGYNSFYRRNAMSKKNKEAMSVLMQYRYKNHIHFINFQNIKDLETDLLFRRCHAVIRVVSKGWFHFFSQKRARQIDVDGNTVSWPDPAFKGSFPDPESVFPDYWEKYENRNEDALSDDSDESDSSDSDGSSDEDEVYLSVKDFGEKVGVTPTTVRNWCNDNDIRYSRLPNGNRRIPESEVDNCLIEYGKGSDDDESS